MTQLEATNKALANLGVATIADIEQDTHNARVMNRLFESARQSVLFDYPWRMAIRTVKPEDLGASDMDAWRYKFLMPGDCIQLWEVYSHGVFVTDYLVRSGYLYTHAKQVEIDYSVDVPFDDWDEVTQEAFTYKLASDAAKVLTGSEQISQQMLQKYQLYGTAAKRMTRNEQNRDFVHSGNYISVRRRGVW